MNILFILIAIVCFYLFLKEKDKNNNISIKKQNTISRYDDSTICSSFKHTLTSNNKINNSNKKTGLSNEISKIDDIVLGEEQQKVYEYMNSSQENLFITGKAGTGKSVLLQYFVNNTSKQVAVVAPTGVAALNIGGQTIHSFFQLSTDVQDTRNEQLVKDIGFSKRAVIKNLDVLVIDEISMVSSDIMDMIDARMKYSRESDLPFGGCQIIVFGDLFQLPPVVTNGQVSRFLEDRYNTIYYFGIDSIKNNPFKTIELKHIFRQKDDRFIEMLNKIRIGKFDQETLDILNNDCVVEPKDDKYITLTGDNATAVSINNRKLNELKTQEYVYTARVQGDIKQAAMPTDYELHLKVGAHVMMIRNDRTDNSSNDKNKKARWVNGTLGIVSYLSNDEIKVEINGVSHFVNKEVWKKYQYYYDSNSKSLEKEEVASFIQYPIRLAYAITIHKSQGQTYDSVKINLSKGAFATGQTYVALSRCRSMDSLYLEKPLKFEDVLVSQEVISYMKNSLIDIDKGTKDSDSSYVIYDVKQGSNEWFKLRENKVTGSIAYMLKNKDVKDIINKNNNANDEYKSEAMIRGHVLEPIGISEFAKKMNIKVTSVGFIESKKINGAGCSPDGVVFDENKNIIAIIEHKAFAEKHHYSCFEKIDNNINFQIQFELFVTGADDAYLILYNPDIENENDRLLYKCIHKDSDIQNLFFEKFNAYNSKV